MKDRGGRKPVARHQVRRGTSPVLAARQAIFGRRVLWVAGGAERKMDVVRGGREIGLLRVEMVGCRR
jgi:hypothetical protein